MFFGREAVAETCAPGTPCFAPGGNEIEIFSQRVQVTEGVGVVVLEVEEALSGERRVNGCRIMRSA